MTVTSGFFNSSSQDRLYDALDMGRILDGVIEDGVFPSIGTTLMVVPVTGMTIAVGIGRAWFHHTWTYNDAPYSLVHDPSDDILYRIDAVVIEINTSDEVRANSFKIIKGSLGSKPSPPAMIHTSLVNQYPLAYVEIGPGVTTILAEKITNKIGSYDCPFVTGPLSIIKTEELLYFKIFWATEAVTIGDGKMFFMVPPYLAGEVVDIDISVITPSSNGIVTVQMANCGNDPLGTGVNMLGTPVTIDQGENNSLTAVSSPTFVNPYIVAGDYLRIDVDNPGTGTMGLDVMVVVEKY